MNFISLPVRLQAKLLQPIYRTLPAGHVGCPGRPQAHAKCSLHTAGATRTWREHTDHPQGQNTGQEGTDQRRQDRQTEGLPQNFFRLYVRLLGMRGPGRGGELQTAELVRLW